MATCPLMKNNDACALPQCLHAEERRHTLTQYYTESISKILSFLFKMKRIEHCEQVPGILLNYNKLKYINIIFSISITDVSLNSTNLAMH
jgi:hypothetical protein